VVKQVEAWITVAYWETTGLKGGSPDSATTWQIVSVSRLNSSHLRLWHFCYLRDHCEEGVRGCAGRCWVNGKQYDECKRLKQCLSVAALLTFQIRKVLVVRGCPVHYGKVSSIPVFYPPYTSSSIPHPGYDNQKCIQTLPNVTWRAISAHLRITNIQGHKPQGGFKS
jgi:hypothetical protein